MLLQLWCIGGEERAKTAAAFRYSHDGGSHRKILDLAVPRGVEV